MLATKKPIECWKLKIFKDSKTKVHPDASHCPQLWGFDAEVLEQPRPQIISSTWPNRPDPFWEANIPGGLPIPLTFQKEICRDWHSWANMFSECSLTVLYFFKKTKPKKPGKKRMVKLISKSLARSPAPWLPAPNKAGATSRPQMYKLHSKIFEISTWTKIY